MARVLEFQVLMHDVASGEFSPEQLDAIAALRDVLRTLLDDEDDLL